MAETTPLDDSTSSSPPLDRVEFITWNVHEGGGDLGALLEYLRAHDPMRTAPPIVLLLQEVHRDGPAVPAWRGDWRVPGSIAPHPPSGIRRSLLQTARDLGYSVFYVPSMRNGPGEGPGTAEDRGNAIVSSLPLSDETAIELPFEYQRRVAVMAAVNFVDAEGRHARIRVVNAHLDTRSAWRRGKLLWFGRTRQVQALLDIVDETSKDDGTGGVVATVLGGDFNSLGGTLEPAVRHAFKRFPQTPRARLGVTFPLIGPLGARLDHLFFRGGADWQGRLARIASRFGSDHYPVALTLTRN